MALNRGHAKVYERMDPFKLQVGNKPFLCKYRNQGLFPDMYCCKTDKGYSTVSIKRPWSLNFSKQKLLAVALLEVVAELF